MSKTTITPPRPSNADIHAKWRKFVADRVDAGDTLKSIALEMRTESPQITRWRGDTKIHDATANMFLMYLREKGINI